MQTMKPPRFQAGGSLRPGSLYVERSADQELPAALLQGQFCYVLAPRQIGKSSLRIRTIAQLEKEGVRCASIDLNWIGKGSEAEWYRGLLGEVSDKLKLNVDVAAFWDRCGGMTPAYRWSLFLSGEALTRVPGRIVVFVDEIDTVKALPFSTDDFFAAVRAVYNMQAENPEYKRLTFCLLGVAAPKDLISNPVITPFNIGRAIQLDDFSPQQAEAFLPGLSAVGGDPRRLLDAILDWTHGHPYMTQRICEALARRKEDTLLEEEVRVAAIVDEIFLRQEDTNLEYAARHFDKEFRGPDVTQMLRVYQRLIDNEQIPADKQDPAQMALRLTGMAAERQDERGVHLRVRNRIFATVFDQNWVKRNQADRLISEPLARWLASGRRDDDLLRGQALEEATEWASGRNDLSPEENDFLRRGLKVANREMEERRRQAEREQAARQAADEAERREIEARGKLDASRAVAQQQRAKRLKWATVILAGFLFTTIVLAVIAFQQRALAQWEKSQVESQKNEIEKQKREVEVQRNKAEKQRNVAEAAQANAEKQKALAEQRSAEAEAARGEAQRQAEIAEEQRKLAEDASAQAKRERVRAEAAAKNARRQEEIAKSERDNAQEQGRIALDKAKEAEKEKEKAENQREQAERAKVDVISARAKGEEEALKRETSVVPHLLAIGRQNLSAKDRVEFFRDNDHLILSGADGITLWQREDKILRSLAGNREIQENSVSETLYSITNSDGNKSIVNARGGLSLSRQKNQTAILSRADDRELVSGKRKITLYGFEDGYTINDLAISPDKKTIALASKDGKVRVWNDKGKKREVVRPRSALLFYFPKEFPWVRWKWEEKSALKELRCVAISPDGKYLVTGDDHVARVFEISSRRLVAELSGHNESIKSVNFSRDGKFIATLSADAVRIYKFELQSFPVIRVGDP
jgi:hypothetical protein